MDWDFNARHPRFDLSVPDRFELDSKLARHFSVPNPPKESRTFVVAAEGGLFQLRDKRVTFLFPLLEALLSDSSDCRLDHPQSLGACLSGWRKRLT